MPLSCISAGHPLNSFDLDDGGWAALRADYRNMRLSMRCCAGPAIPKVSSLGTRFFAHKSRGACRTAPESPEHLKTKFIIAASAKAAGWETSTEASGADLDGNPWSADVLCARGGIKVAFEVQLASRSLEQYRARQARYRRSGIRCLWLTKLRRRASTIESIPPSKDLLLVLLDVGQVTDMTVRVGEAEAPIPLAEFVTGSLAGQFFWAETRPGGRAVEVQMASIACRKCGKAFKAIRGYIINNHLVPLADVSNAETLATFVSVLRRRAPEVGPIARRYSRTAQRKYLAAACPFCSVPLGDWFMTADFFAEVATCDYPDCGCRASSRPLARRWLNWESCIFAQTRSAPPIRGQVNVICLRRRRHRERFGECWASLPICHTRRKRKSEGSMKRAVGSLTLSAKSKASRALVQPGRLTKWSSSARLSPRSSGNSGVPAEIGAG